jgi:manganese/zinc/iron transport system permease protein
MAGMIFAIVFIVAPERGILAVFLRKKRQRFDFASIMLAAHLLNHENDPDAEMENCIDHLSDHLNWEPAFANQVVNIANQKGFITIDGKCLYLSDLGRKQAIQKFMVN